MAEANGTVIGPAMQAIIATRYVLYGISNDMVVQYQNTPNEWNSVSDAGQFSSLATDDLSLFGLAASDQSVYQFQAADIWMQIGPAMAALSGGGKMLYGLTKGSSEVYGYEGQPDAWTQIGGPMSALASNGNHLAALATDGSTVMLYQPQGSSWIQIGQNMSSLYMAPNALYAIGADGKTLYRWQGTPNTWLQVGQGWNRFSAVGTDLYAISIDNSTVGQFTGTPGQWQPFSTDATGITDDERYVYLNNAQSVRQLPATNAPSEPVPHTFARDDAAAPLDDWSMTFQVANEAFAAYDGHIKVTIFQNGGRTQKTLTLPRSSFGRGTTYHFQFQIPSATYNALETISVGGEENFFNDQLHLGSIKLFDPGNSKLYTAEFNKLVPTSGTIAATPSVKTAHTIPGVATVFVWNYLGKDVAWGHASIELDDGTYISWWPQGVDRKHMPLLPQIYTVNAMPNQTFANDVSLESGHQPDWRVAVGGLDHNKIRTWWNTFKTTHQWSTLSQNCSTTVADALWAGGASSVLTPREADNFSAILVWTPSDALSFAQTIDAHLT